MKNILKGTGAVLAGLITIIILSVGTDFIMETIGVFPGLKEQKQYGFFTWWMLLVALVYRIIYSVAGCYITASLAPNRPMLHAMILGAIGVVISTVGTIVMWDKSTAWYPISLILVSFPCAWLGGKLKESKK